MEKARYWTRYDEVKAMILARAAAVILDVRHLQINSNGVILKLFF